MNKAERKNLEKELISEGWNKNVAKYHIYRSEIFTKLGANKFFNYLDNEWGKEIKSETNKLKLAQTDFYGNLKTLSSYPILMASGITAMVTLNPLFFLGAGYGVYLNCKGEIEFLNARNRMDELGLNKEEVHDRYQKYLKIKSDRKSRKIKN